MNNSQFLGSNLITPPSVRPYLSNQRYSNLIIRNAQPEQQISYGIGRSIIGHKGMGNPRLFLAILIHPCRDCNQHQGFPFGPAPALARKCRPQERFIYLYQTGQLG